MLSGSLIVTCSGEKAVAEAIGKRWVTSWVSIANIATEPGKVLVDFVSREGALKTIAYNLYHFVCDIAASPNVHVYASCVSGAASNRDDMNIRRLLKSAEMKAQIDEPGVYVHDMGLAAKSVDTLQQAIEQGRYEVELEPVIALEESHPVGYEMLARINGIQTESWLPYLLSSGYSRLLATANIALLPKCLQASNDKPISLNLFTTDILSDAVLEALLSQPKDVASRVFIELSERAREDGDAVFIKRISALTAHGYRLSIDDFNTGHSTIFCASMLPISCIKVDISITQSNSHINDYVCEMLLKVSRDLGAHLIAEGIQSEMDLNRTIHRGIRYGQGFLFKKDVLRVSFGNTKIRSMPNVDDDDPGIANIASFPVYRQAMVHH